MPEDSTNASADIIAASAKVVEASAKLVEQVGTIVERSISRGPLTRVEPAADAADSAGWLEAQLVADGARVAEARKVVVDRGTAYYTKHKVVAASPKAYPREADFGRVYRYFFSDSQLAQQHEALRRFQVALGFFEPSNKARTIGDLNADERLAFPKIPADDAVLPLAMANFVQADARLTIPQAIGRLMATFNIDTATGAPAARDSMNPSWLIELSHAQCVMFHHVLRSQEDIQLVAPYSGQIW